MLINCQVKVINTVMTVLGQLSHNYFWELTFSGTCLVMYKICLSVVFTWCLVVMPDMVMTLTRIIGYWHTLASIYQPLYKLVSQLNTSY